MTQQNQELEALNTNRLIRPSMAQLVSDAPSSDEELQQQEDSLSDEEKDLESLDLSALDLPQEESKQEPQTTPEYKKFEEDFKKYLGLDLKEAIQTVQELQSFKQQQIIDSQKQQLKQTWGVSDDEFDYRMKLVLDRFSKYSPDMQARLDNLEGAQLIWAKIQQEQLRSKSNKQVPSLDKATTTIPNPGSNKYLFTREQIAKMSNDEYARNADKIAYAFANGLVK